MNTEMRSVSFPLGLGLALVCWLSACGASPQTPSKVAIRVPPAPVPPPESITPAEACRRLVGATERLLAQREASRIEALEKERAENPRAKLPAKPEPMDRDGLDLVTGKDACVAGDDGVAWAYSLESYVVDGWWKRANEVRIGIRFMGKNGKASAPWFFSDKVYGGKCCDMGPTSVSYSDLEAFDFDGDGVSELFVHAKTWVHHGGEELEGVVLKADVDDGNIAVSEQGLG